MHMMSPDSDNPKAFDPLLAGRLLAPIHWGLRSYFRYTVRDLERIPSGPVLLVGNHNAGITSFDPLMLGAAYYKARGFSEPLYFLAHDVMMALPGLGHILGRLGGVRANHDNGSLILARGGKVVVYPGGNYEAFRPFKHRHRIELAGHQGFIRLALKAGVPLVPFVNIGGHETFFVLSRGERLAKKLYLKELLRSDTCALSLGLPWGLFLGPMFHFPLPAKSVIQMGLPLRFKDEGFVAADSDRPHIVEMLYRRVEQTMQEMMDQLAHERHLPLWG
jgi:1-acyl-sn-glycerol-3-phosphate acyltransferase